MVGLLRRGVGTVGRVAGEGGVGTLLSAAVPPRLTCEASVRPSALNSAAVRASGQSQRP